MEAYVCFCRTGLSGQCRIHGSGQLGDRPGRGITLRLCVHLVILMSNVMAVLLQTLSARLGIVTGKDLAQACRSEYSKTASFALWILCEIAIAACDLAEVLGTILGLNLLFGLPLLWGALVTLFDTFLLLAIQRLGMRKMEAFILSLITVIAGGFLINLFLAKPDWGAAVAGLTPSLPVGSLYIILGIIGATVMPHNLYLHSSLVQTRRVFTDHRREGPGLQV